LQTSQNFRVHFWHSTLRARTIASVYSYIDETPFLPFLFQVVVPNVVRHPNMKFFGVPKMGAYVAVPVK